MIPRCLKCAYALLSHCKIAIHSLWSGGLKTENMINRLSNFIIIHRALTETNKKGVTWQLLMERPPCQKKAKAPLASLDLPLLKLATSKQNRAIQTHDQLLYPHTPIVERGLSRESQVTINFSVLWSYKCVIWCCVSDLSVVSFIPQIWHSKSLISKWTFFMWFVYEIFLENSFPHISHFVFFTPLWIRMWCFSSRILVRKDLLQITHSMLSISLWVWRC